MGLDRRNGLYELDEAGGRGKVCTRLVFPCSERTYNEKGTSVSLTGEDIATGCQRGNQADCKSHDPEVA